MTISKKISMLAILIISITGSAFAQQSTKPLNCRHIPIIQEGYLNYHIRYKKFTPNLEKRLIDQILKRLDPLKVYLLKSDENKIRKMYSGIFRRTQNLECSSIYNANAYVIEKMEDRVLFVKKFLREDYKFDQNIKIVLDADERSRFDSVKEMNAFHKKYIQFQISNYLMSKTTLSEAKKNVIKNYERILKRLKQETEQDHITEYLDAFAHALDPHSTFFSADALANFRIQMSLSLEGIGATLSLKDGFTVVENLVPGGAADKSGQLKPKDKIVAIRQENSKKAENIIEMDLNDVVKKIRGKKGTKVFLSILRKEKGETKRMEIQLIRDKINLEDEAAKITYHKKRVEDEEKLIGLINLPSFYGDNKIGRSSAKDVKNLIDQAKAKNVHGIVFDLSANGGGSLLDAVKIAGFFLKTGNIVKQSFSNPKKPVIALADVDETINYSGPLVILISRASASASEIVSGALKDYGRALIVGGDHTFGKGTVQSIRDLPERLGALKVTIGMFFTAGGYSTQHRGVAADIVLPSIFSNKDIGEKTYDYSLPPKKLPSFISADAFVHNGPLKWQIIDKKMIASLQTASKIRIEKNKKFKEIIDEIAKSKKRGKVLDIAKIMKEKSGEKDSDKTLSRKEKQKKYFQRADISEALNIALDLILLHENKPITVGVNHTLKPVK